MLTHVEVHWHEGAREDWFKFGKPVASRIIDRHVRTESYAPEQVFALVRWAANEHGTIRSSLDIVRTVARGEAYTTLAQVDPGGDILLAVSGWPKVAQVFRLIDAIEATGIDPCVVAPDHWRHVHNRLAIAAKPRAYKPERHLAWLARWRIIA
ncbi:MAG: glycosidase [Sphingopyxis sp.]|nr:glycosidase [Sphingopyxis sp.]